MLALVGSSLFGTSASAADDQDHAETPEPLPTKVLFIGNSHTQRNGGLDWLIGNMVRSEETPRPFEGTVRAVNGMTLEYHYKNGAPQAIRTGDYDVVVLQGYLAGLENRSATAFLEYARLLDEEVRRSGARTVYFMTWRQGGRSWATLDDLITSHRQLAEETGAAVAPAGVAFALSEAERPDLRLIGDDGIHATWEGAYLAAATVYATLFERSPVGLAYTFGVAPDDAAFLQRIAWQAVTDWNSGSGRSTSPGLDGEGQVLFGDDAVTDEDIAVSADGDADG